MLREKKNTVLPKKQDIAIRVEQPEEVALNPFVEMYQAVKRTLLTIREEENMSEPYFKTIAVDNGQFQRIIRDSTICGRR